MPFSARNQLMSAIGASKARRIVDFAEGDQTSAIVDGFVELLPRNLARGILIQIIGKLIVQGDDVVAWRGRDSCENNRQGSSGISDEGDIFGIGVNETRDTAPHAIGVGVPVKEIGAGEFIAPFGMPRHRFDRTSRHLAVGRGIEIGPAR